MKLWLVRLLHVTVALSLSPLPTGAQTAGEGAQASGTASIPRTRDGKPDLSGIWQVLNRANDNLLAHSASEGVPGGLGVLEGDEIPYRPEALKQKQENFANRQTRDTEANCYLPGVPRITYIPFPFQIIQLPEVTTILLRVRARDSLHLYGREPASRRPHRVVDGGFAGPLGGGHAGRRRGAFRQPNLVRQDRQLSQ